MFLTNYRIYFKYIFHVKIMLFVTLKSYQDPDSWILLIRICIENKLTEKNADPQHWLIWM